MPTAFGFLFIVRLSPPTSRPNLLGLLRVFQIFFYSKQNAKTLDILTQLQYQRQVSYIINVSYSQSFVLFLYSNGMTNINFIQYYQAKYRNNNRNYMLNQIKCSLENNDSPQIIISSLSESSLVYNLTDTHLDELVKIVEGRQGNYKLHPKVSTVIYSIVVMKQYQNYNTKLAIQLLTKYYRQLSGNNETDDQQTDKTAASNKNNKTRTVIANLLIRIPTFSNYKLIVKDLNPDFSPVSLIQQHKSSISKQCPNLYRDYLIKQHKHEWYELIIHDENYPIWKQFENIKEKLTLIPEMKDLLEIDRVFRYLNKEFDYLRNRIFSIDVEQIEIEKLCEIIQQILTFEVSQTKDRVLLLKELLTKQSFRIRHIKNSVVQLLRLLIQKLQFYFFRKFNWLVKLCNQLLNKTWDQYSIEPSYTFSLMTTLLEKYGIGFYNFDKIVHNQDINSISVLLSALCYNDYSQNSKKSENLVNFQGTKKQNKKNTIHINLYNTSEVDNAYQTYLKTTTVIDRQLLMKKILFFLQSYYQAKGSNGMQFYHSSEIFKTLSTSKNDISSSNKQIINDIKTNVLFRGYKRVGQYFESFCQDMFNMHIKKKQQRKFTIQRSCNICIQEYPGLGEKDKEQKITELRAQENKLQIKDSQMQGIQFEGWATQKNQTKNAIINHGFNPEQSSLLGQKDQQNQAAEEQYIITPDF